MKCKTDVMTCACDKKVHCSHWSISVINNLMTWFVTIKWLIMTVSCTFEIFYMLLSFECLNIWYMKGFHPNIFNLTVYTKLDMGVLYMNFLSNQRIHQYSIISYWVNT